MGKLIDASMNEWGPVVVLGRPGLSTHVISDELRKSFPEVVVIHETPDSAFKQMRTRFRRFGLARGGGQLLFRAFSPILALSQRARKEQLQSELLAGREPQSKPFAIVRSVNSPTARRLLRELRPSVVVISGTRIVSRKTLESAPLFLNMHAGITPCYRGVHGGYWAKASDDSANFGVTVHRVDPGVDTGDVIFQERCCPDPEDGFFTFPLVQLGVGLPLLVSAVSAGLKGTLTRASIDDDSSIESKQWYHPTIVEYLKVGLTKGVW